MLTYVDLHLRIIFQYVPMKLSSLFDLHRNGGNISREPQEPQGGAVYAVGVNQMPERLRLHEQFFHPLQGPNKARAFGSSREPRASSPDFSGLPTLKNQWILAYGKIFTGNHQIFPHEIWGFPEVSCHFSLKPIH